MADINKLKDKIKSTIYPNGKGAINASDHQAMLLDMADGMAETDTKLAELSAVIGLEGANNIDLSNANSGYISATTGNINADTGYKYTNPIQVKKGQVVRVVSVAATSVAVISWTDANATYREPTLAGRGNVTPEEYYYVADRDGLLVVCYLSIRNHAVTIYDTKVYEEITKIGERVGYNSAEIANVSSAIGLKGKEEIDLSNANSGYLGANSGEVYSDSYYCYSNPIQVKKGQSLIFFARVATSVAAICLTDANATFRTPVVKGDGSANSTEYRYLVEKDGYVIVCFYKAKEHSVSLIHADIYNLILEQSDKIAGTNTELSKLSKAYIEDDLVSSATNATKQGVQITQGTYGKDSAKYKVDASAFGNTTGVCHIAFDFKINEDVNIGEVVDKSFFRIEKDTWYADFVLKCGATSVFEGKEAKGSHTLTTTRSGMPYFNSCFGTRSNWNTGGDRLNLFMDTRSFHYDDNNKSHCYKPLCGKDLFSIQLIAVDGEGKELDTLSADAQAIYKNWQDAYVEVTSTAVNVVSQTNAINETFAYANFSTMTALFAAIYTKLHNKIGNGVKWSVTDIGTSYYASETPNLVKCKIYLSSEHPSSNNSTFYDAFPAYLSHAIDDSWHTFELVSRADQDVMYFCIDGQYYGNADSRNWSIDNIRYIFKNATLIFGGELNVTFRNLLIESDSYQHAEVGKGVHYIISKRNPYILCLFLHEMYYAPNVGGDFSSYMTFESSGGKIPDALKNPNANYVGDDYIQESRKTVTFPSWSIEDVVSRLHNKGYMCISKKDLPKVMSGEICNPKNRYYIMDIDDHQTYIYDREDCRNIFTRYNCRPCFANELGFYLTKEISDELAGYDVANFIESYCKDTNEHRLALQKRLQSLLHSGWTLDIHGSKEGYTFQGKTYQQMKAEILNAINISKFYGLPINAWCYAANYYTPNAVKLIKSMGIEYGTSTASQPIGKCRDNGFLPRIMITTNVANNIKVII